MDYQEIIKKAFDAAKYSYSPYSNFKVGACVEMNDGVYFLGTNIENAAYSPGNCAERTAIFKAVSEGKKNFKAICIVNEGADHGHDYCPPCGVCRQVMMEFCDPERFVIILARGRNDYQCYYLKELQPLGFGPGNLKK